MKSFIKRILSIAICFVLILAEFSIVAAEGENGVVKVIDYSVKTDGTKKVVTVKLHNNSGSTQYMGVGVIGADADGNALEARGGYTYAARNTDGVVELEFKAGNKITDFKVIAGNGTNTGEIRLLGYGSYYDEVSGRR